ncbi:hypothetical protein BC826DRAFT_1025892 [Russula brevipes]|nr:hypothetical protein BC826DRAFT_1025892 [Russula brevipes]
MPLNAVGGGRHDFKGVARSSDVPRLYVHGISDRPKQCDERVFMLGTRARITPPRGTRASERLAPHASFGKKEGTNVLLMTCSRSARPSLITNGGGGRHAHCL